MEGATPIPGRAAGPVPRATPAPAAASASEPVIPSDLKVKLAEQKLVVTWADGSKVTYDLAILRRHCPCATCRGERDEPRAGPAPLTILKSDPRQLKAVGAKLVGRYAIQLQWSDGHDTGIFDFQYLRTLPASATG